VTGVVPHITSERATSRAIQSLDLRQKMTEATAKHRSRERMVRVMVRAKEAPEKGRP
jgi:hypothetical protein